MRNCDTPSEILNRALGVLEDRLRILAAPVTVSDHSDWALLDPVISALVPGWYKSILSRWSLCNAVMECPGRGDDVVRVFSFLRPSDFAVLFAAGSLIHRLVDSGFFPVGNESDGNLWLCRSADGPM